MSIGIYSRKLAKHNNGMFKKGHTLMKGKKLSAETRKKISDACKGRIPPNKGKKMSDEQKRKIGLANSIALKGNRLSEETKRKISKINSGKKLSEETKRKISKIQKYRKHKPQEGFQKRDNNLCWNNGSSFEQYSLEWSATLRRSIRERDRYSCQLCGELQSDYAFSVHHIDYDKKNCNPKNLITLCRNCHSKTNFNRNHWKNYFYK